MKDILSVKLMKKLLLKRRLDIFYMVIGSSEKFKSAGGNSFNIKKGTYIYTYDKNCNQLSYRVE